MFLGPKTRKAIWRTVMPLLLLSTGLDFWSKWVLTHHPYQTPDFDSQRTLPVKGFYDTTVYVSKPILVLLAIAQYAPFLYFPAIVFVLVVWLRERKQVSRGF